VPLFSTVQLQRPPAGGRFASNEKTMQKYKPLHLWQDKAKLRSGLSRTNGTAKEHVRFQRGIAIKISAASLALPASLLIGCSDFLALLTTSRALAGSTR